MELGRVRALFRYPVKSMAGASLETATLGWHGIEGDRRFAFRRLWDNGGFPWLSASRLPQLILYKPERFDESGQPATVRTPEGNAYGLRSDELRDDVSNRYGAPLELMNFKHGIFDEGSISVISLATMLGIEREAGRALDVRRFRPNIVLEDTRGEPFEENTWVGRTLRIGDVALGVQLRDERCAMVNFDPESAEQDAIVIKTIVRLNGNCAGAYCTVVRTGEIRVGQTVTLED